MADFQPNTKPISSSRLLQSLLAIWVPYYRDPFLFGALPTLRTAVTGTFNLLDNLVLRPNRQLEANAAATLLTLTINPDVTRLWHYFMRQSLDSAVQIVIVDSSGQLKKKQFPGAKIIRMWNFAHSRKIDYLLYHICKNQYIWLCDDDVMILNSEALTGAMNSFADADQKIAAVSFIPNDIDLVINGKQHQGMGSYCLLIDRNVFMKERLSFSSGKSSNRNFRSGYYDTGDYANELLLKRGYQVKFLIDPKNKYRYVCGFDGVDSARLRLLAGKASFIKEIKQSDVRTARHRIIGAYCNWKVVELYREVFQEEPVWLPPCTVKELRELTRYLGDYYVNAIESQFELYDLRMEILRQHFSVVQQRLPDEDTANMQRIPS